METYNIKVPKPQPVLGSYSDPFPSDFLSGIGSHFHTQLICIASVHLNVNWQLKTQLKCESVQVRKLLMLWNRTQKNLLSAYGRVTSMAWSEQLCSTFFSSPASAVNEWNGSNFQTIRLGDNFRKLTASIKMEQSLVCWNFGLHNHFCNHFVYSWAIQYFSQYCGYNTIQWDVTKA